MHTTIYHNPACSNSRGALGLIREAGIEPEIIEYLKTPPDRTTLAQMIADAGLTVRGAMREKEPVYRELALDDAGLTDEALLDAMLAHPVLINRPFVVTQRGTRLCRPADLVLEIMPPCSQESV